MSGIKYYQLKEDEELPNEFCAVKDVNGEPSEYTFYRPETENVKLRKLARWMYRVMDESCAVHYPYEPAPVSIQALARAEKELEALGIEVMK